LEELRLHEAAQEIYDFTWHEFADVYIEVSKKQLQDESLKNSTKQNLSYILFAILKILHPFMPFVTEVIWGEIKDDKNLLMTEKWPI